MKNILLVLFLLVPLAVPAQPQPPVAASVQQTIDGLLGPPFYITPYDAAQAGFGSGGTGGITAAGLTASLASGTNTVNLTNASAGTLPRTAADGSWDKASNYVGYITGSVAPTAGKFLTFTGTTNAFGAFTITPTNAPSGSGFPLTADVSFGGWSASLISGLYLTNQIVVTNSSANPTNFIGGTVYMETNNSPFRLITPSGLNSIALNKGWTNNFNRRADIEVSVAYSDSATGSPIIGVTNTISGYATSNSFNLGIIASPIMTWIIVDISPGDYGSFSNYSTGSGASVTINQAWWHLK